MHRKDFSRIQFVNLCRKLFGYRMDIPPVFVVLPVFEDGKVNMREPFADFREMGKRFPLSPPI
ncbi:hypothetical protein [Parabacteroides johnsonii]|uniref:hypothetical protein n=1 Tax=Parabacteroides johnsonii TaxID=387661 RepID=UPI000316A40F